MRQKKLWPDWLRAVQIGFWQLHWDGVDVWMLLGDFQLEQTQKCQSESQQSHRGAFQEAIVLAAGPGNLNGSECRLSERRVFTDSSVFRLLQLQKTMSSGQVVHLLKSFDLEENEAQLVEGKQKERWPTWRVEDYEAGCDWWTRGSYTSEFYLFILIFIYFLIIIIIINNIFNSFQTRLHWIFLSIWFNFQDFPKLNYFSRFQLHKNCLQTKFLILYMAVKSFTILTSIKWI